MYTLSIVYKPPAGRWASTGCSQNHSHRFPKRCGGLFRNGQRDVRDVSSETGKANANVNAKVFSWHDPVRPEDRKHSENPTRRRRTPEVGRWSKDFDTVMLGRNPANHLKPYETLWNPMKPHEKWFFSPPLGEGFFPSTAWKDQHELYCKTPLNLYCQHNRYLAEARCPASSKNARAPSMKIPTGCSSVQAKLIGS